MEDLQKDIARLDAKERVVPLERVAVNFTKPAPAPGAAPTKRGKGTRSKKPVAKRGRKNKEQEKNDRQTKLLKMMPPPPPPPSL